LDPSAPAPLPPALQAAWAHTRVRIDLGDRVLMVPAIAETPPGGRCGGMSPRPRNGRLDAYGLLGERAWVITAWNPGGRLLSDAENVVRHTAFADAVRAAGVRAYPAVGEARDGGWCEEGLALVGIETPTAWRWAWELHQLGFFEVTRAGMRIHRAR